jgi:alkanesulfonate monooxygenase SsuD/methylene tetrahydromethanopterin reductase-like flavin-dependent oxidoreductase (luciferase family)
MRLSSRLGYGDGFVKNVEFAVKLEEVGLDVLWVAEVYGADAATRLGYLAARTHRVELASGIFPIYSRTPALLAMTAAGLDEMSNGRAILGLGASGPQVIEGWHGVPFDRPVQRTREIVELRRPRPQAASASRSGDRPGESAEAAEPSTARSDSDLPGVDGRPQRRADR